MTTKTKVNTAVTAEEFDALFDAGDASIHDHIDWAGATQPNLAVRRINLDLPEHLLAGLDAVAAYLAIPRQAVIKTMLVQALKAGTLSM